MVLKRPFDGEELCELPWKQPRQFECRSELASFIDVVSRNDLTQKPEVPDKGEGGFNNSQIEDSLATGNVGDDKGLEIGAPSSIPSFPWVTGSTSEENLKLEAADDFPYSPDFSEIDHSTRTQAAHRDVYSTVFDSLPRRLVPVGPDHQADIPVWGAPVVKSASWSIDTEVPSNRSCDSLISNQNIDDEDSDKFVGTCVIPMPDSDASVFGQNKVGKGRSDCSCEDEGSARCVRQHIAEARENLVATLGLEIFVKLGFLNMGEEVAKKWTGEEQQVFHEVVFSNPVSLGRNFWNHLSDVFPSRTKKEIVSYYFNVFMLRKRGEQNRLDPLNVDSDNDEWQGSEDGDDELGSSEEEDEDSVVESPADDLYPVYNRNNIDLVNEDDDGVDDESYENDVGNEGDATRAEDNGKLGCVSEACNGKSPEDGSFGLLHRHNCEEDNDLQDDSCTSYECQLSRMDFPSIADGKQECRVESDHGKHFQNSYDGLSSLDSLGFQMEPCDSKGWDVEFHSSCKTKVDLLPTCNMIEEVFGDESWNYSGRDGKGMN